MPVLTFTHLPRPKNFHEIAGFRLVKVIEVLSKPELVKKTGGARPICIPAPPDSFPVALISNDQLFQRGIIYVKFPARAQGLDRSDEHEICCTRAKARRGRRRQNEKFPGLKMGRRLQADLGETRNRITAALRHLFNLLKDQAIVIFGKRYLRRESKNRDEGQSTQSLHGEIDKRQKAIWQRSLTDGRHHT